MLWDSLEQKASYTRAGRLQEMGQSKEQPRRGCCDWPLREGIAIKFDREPMHEVEQIPN